MRILVDIQALQSDSKFRGIGRFTLGFIKALIAIKDKYDIEVFLLLNGSFDPRDTNFLINELTNFIDRNHIKVWYGVDFEFIPIRENPSPFKFDFEELYEHVRQHFIELLNVDAVVHTSMFEGYLDKSITGVRKKHNVPTFCVLHDIIPFMNQAQYLDTDKNYKKWYLNRLEYLKRCDGLLSISEYSTYEAVTYLNYPEHNILTISSAIDYDEFYPDISNMSKLSNKPYILYTGAGDSRKNHFRLIRAFSLLPQEIKDSYTLVLAGYIHEPRKEEFEEFAKKFNLTKKHVIVKNKVSDEELRKLYSNCYLYVFPSLYEGFGLPILEAMACGAPVIGSNNSSVPEVINYVEALFDPYSEYSIRDKMLQALTDQDFYQKLLLNSKLQTQVFSWHRTASRAIEFIKKNSQEIYNDTHNKSYKILSEDENHSANSIYTPLVNDLKVNHSKALRHLSNTSLVGLAQGIEINTASIFDKKVNNIYFDISELYRSRHHTGIQRVARKILHYFADKLNTGYNIVPIYFDEKFGKFRFTSDADFDFCFVTEQNLRDNQVISPKLGDIYITNDLMLEISDRREWAIANMRNIGVEFYFMIHDILPTQLPQFFPSHFESLFENYLNFIAAYHDGIICISESVALEVRDWYQEVGKYINRDIKIDYSHNGTDLVDTDDIHRTINQKERLFIERHKNDLNFLMVGTMEPRKGHIDVIMAFESYLEQGGTGNLLIVGKYGWNISSTVEILQSSKYFSKKIIWLDKVDDTFLEHLYDISDVLIAASYAEGFGLPLIEAFQRNLQVIARDIPVFREVGKSYATYFTDINELTKILLNYKKLHNNVSRPDYLTWEQSAKSFWSVILKNEWPYSLRQTYKKDSLSYNFTDRNYMHLGAVAKLVSNGVSTQDEEGWLIYGPYLQFSEGRYLVKVEFKHFEPSESFIDIYSDRDKEIFFKDYLKNLAKDDKKNTVVSFAFVLNKQIEDLEIRIFVDEEADLCISKIGIVEVDI